jgi:hypothetical protein
MGMRFLSLRLYRSRELGTLPCGDRSHGDRSRAALDSLARAVSTLLRPPRAAARAADVRARRVQRQRSEIDAGDAVRIARGRPASRPSASPPPTTGAIDDSLPRCGSCANRIWARRRAPKYFFINLPQTASVKALVRLAHQRWAIEQHYQELKTELGLDHFAKGARIRAGPITSSSRRWRTPSYSESGCAAAPNSR